MTKILQKYITQGNNVLPFKQQEGMVVDKIAPAYYTLRESPLVGYYLEKISDSIELPDEIYGSTKPRANTIINAFERKKTNIGVGLFGSKGAGKTLLASYTSQQCIEKGLPVIDVSRAFSPEEDCLDFLNSLGDCVILFDEFLKHLKSVSDFHEDDNPDGIDKAQDKLLTFLSGTADAARIIFLIDNDSSNLSEFILDRPSRMRYRYTYDGIEEEVAYELCKKYELPEKDLAEFITYAIFKGCTFDMCNEILEEVYSTGVDWKEVVEDMNVPNNFIKQTEMEVVSVEDNSTNTKVVTETKDSGQLDKKLFNLSVPCIVTFPWYGLDKGSEEWEEATQGFSGASTYNPDGIKNSYIRFHRQDLISIGSGMYTFDNGNYKVTVKEKE